MSWIIGIDEAGYGPNLGPFVMTSVACQVPDHLDSAANLWHLLRDAVRSVEEEDDGRLLVADSKLVYSSGRGLAGLERGVFAALRPALVTHPPSLAALLQIICPDSLHGLEGESWFRGVTPLPLEVQAEELVATSDRFSQACAAAGATRWIVRSLVLCPAGFNAVLDAEDSKGAVLTHGLAYLLRHNLAHVPDRDTLCFFVDKHGGRNTYAALVQHSLGSGVVLALQEGMARSVYQVLGMDRDLRLTFQPRADREHFCVALASMASKYLRELLMAEFNHFWTRHVPGLKPTAGYPGDAARFFQAIRPVAERLGIEERTLWRRK